MGRIARKGAVAGLVLVLAGTGAVPGAAQDWRTVSKSRQVSGERSVSVEVEYGAGRFTVGPGRRGVLYEMDLTYDERHFEPVSEYRDGRLRLGIDGRHGNVDLDRDNRSSLELALSPDVVLDMVLEFGAVKAELDLGGLSISDLQVTTGASETHLRVGEPNRVPMGRAHFEVGAASFEMEGLGNLNARELHVEAGVGNVEMDFDGAWQQDLEVFVEMGMGAVQFRFPEDVGVRLTKDTFLTHLDAQRMEKRGNAYYSRNWDTADHRITVEVEAAFGSIEVDWLRR